MLAWSIDFAQRYAGLFIGLTLVSIFSAAITMIVGVRIIARLPADYFVNQERRVRVPPRFAVVRLGLLAMKNLLGAVFVVAGVAMLVLPGQGILTLVAGILLMDFPGKFAIERRLVRQRQVRTAIDFLRKRAGEPSLILDDE